MHVGAHPIFRLFWMQRYSVNDSTDRQKENLEPIHSSLPDYYVWSLCDINTAYTDLFDRRSAQRIWRFTDLSSTQLESLSYFHCKKLRRFSLMYDQLIDGNSIYSTQHFGTSHMRKPHPMRYSLPDEERSRWMPVRSSSVIGRRAHLPLDLVDRRAISMKK